MAIQTQMATADELLKMPDDGFRYELVRGELKEISLAGRQHGKVAIELAWQLAQYVEENQLGEVYAVGTGFRLSSNPDTVLAPDVSFVRQERVESLEDDEELFTGEEI